MKGEIQVQCTNCNLFQYVPTNYTNDKVGLCEDPIQPKKFQSSEDCVLLTNSKCKVCDSELKVRIWKQKLFPCFESEVPTHRETRTKKDNDFPRLVLTNETSLKNKKKKCSNCGSVSRFITPGTITKKVRGYDHTYSRAVCKNCSAEIPGELLMRSK